VKITTGTAVKQTGRKAGKNGQKYPPIWGVLFSQVLVYQGNRKFASPLQQTVPSHVIHARPNIDFRNAAST
jgi:hypothetical protein